MVCSASRTAQAPPHHVHAAPVPTEEGWESTQVQPPWHSKHSQPQQKHITLSANQYGGFVQLLACNIVKNL